MYYTYILVSEHDNSYYIGSTGDIHRRIKEHNAGNSRYTAKKGPWILFYKERYSTRAEAMSREKQIKSWKKRAMIEKLKTKNQ